MTTRSELINRLAEVSHETYIRQRVRDKNESREAVIADVGEHATEHDVERAKDILTALKELKVLKPLQTK